MPRLHLLVKSSNRLYCYASKRIFGSQRQKGKQIFPVVSAEGLVNAACIDVFRLSCFAFSTSRRETLLASRFWSKAATRTERLRSGDGRSLVAARKQHAVDFHPRNPKVAERVEIVESGFEQIALGGEEIENAEFFDFITCSNELHGLG